MAFCYYGAQATNYCIIEYDVCIAPELLECSEMLQSTD